MTSIEMAAWLSAGANVVIAICAVLALGKISSVKANKNSTAAGRDVTIGQAPEDKK